MYIYTILMCTYGAVSDTNMNPQEPSFLNENQHNYQVITKKQEEDK